MGGARLVQPLAIGVVGRKPARRKRDSARRLAGLPRLGRAQVIKPAPGVGFDIGQRLVLLHKIGQHPGECGMLVHIGQVPGMIQVLIGQHGPALSGFARLEKPGSA